MSTTLAPRPTRRTVAWNVARGILAVALLIHLFIASALITVREQRLRVDAVTGSQECETIWMFGWTAGPQIKKSPLELRLQKANISWRSEWKFTHATSRALLGNATCRSCGAAPPIYLLSMSQKTFVDFVEGSTDNELRQFVQTMQSSSEQEQHLAVEAAAETGMRYFEENQDKG